jgi:hypothetical protein
VRSTFLVVLFSVGLLSPGCGEDYVDFFQSVPPDPAYPGTPGDPTDYQDLLAYTPNPQCAPDVPRVLDCRTEIRIFRGNGITMDMAVRFVGGLKRYFDYYGVLIYTRHDVIQVPIDHAIVLNSRAIADWMRENTDVDPSCMSRGNSTACDRAMGAAMFYNVKEFFHAYAEPPLNVINVVLLKRVAALEPDEDAAELAWGIAGLGLSEELINSVAGSDLGTSLGDILDETNFAPTIFLGVNLVDFVLPEPDIVIAHEFGHAYGLEHLTASSESGNLMYPTANQCNQSLNLSQLSAIEQAAARYGNSLLATHDDPLAFLSFEDRAAEILDIVRSRIARETAAEKKHP